MEPKPKITILFPAECKDCGSYNVYLCLEDDIGDCILRGIGTDNPHYCDYNKMLGAVPFNLQEGALSEISVPKIDSVFFYDGKTLFVKDTHKCL